MNVALPQNDANFSMRTDELNRARSYYEYDYSYYNLGFAHSRWLKRDADKIREAAVCQASTPSRRGGIFGKLESMGKRALGEVHGTIQAFDAEHFMEGYRPELSHEFMRAYLQWLVNRAKADAVTRQQDTEQAAKHALAKGQKLITTLLRGKHGRHDILSQIVELGQKLWPAELPRTLQGYESMFQSIAMPELAKNWDEDWAFAYQTVAGCLPTRIECIDTIPENFAVDEEMYAKVMGVERSLAEDLRDKKVFLLDFSVFDGFSGGVAYGQQKYIYAPMALFAWRDTNEHDGFGLTPVAIQCGQRAGEDYPVFTPHDGWRWKMARFCVQVATGMYRGANLHFGTLHIVMERVCIALKRALAPNHPLHILLDQSFRSTLATNATTKTFTFIDGYSSLLLAPTMPASIQLILDGVDNFSFNDACPTKSFKARGVDRQEVLPIYPFREDTTKLWGAIEDFCREYVTLYYGDDRDVLDDRELQSFVHLLQAPEGGRLRGIGRDGKITTVEDLTQLVAQIVYHGSAFHSAINYSGFDATAFPPAMCYSGFAPAPTMRTPNTEASFLTMLPPMEWAWLQLLLNLDQITIWENLLGHFPPGYFEDARVAPLVERFNQKLARIEGEVEAANSQRPLAYNHQKPSLVTASIES